MKLLIIASDITQPTYVRLAFQCTKLSIDFETLNPDHLTQEIVFKDLSNTRILNRYTAVEGRDYDLEILSNINQDNCINQFNGIRLCRSKLFQNTYFSHHEIPMIPSLFIQGVLDQDSVTDFLKTNGEKYISKPLRGNGGKGITLFESHRSLLSYLETCHVMKDQSFIIQPFINSKIELRLLMINYQPLIILQKEGDISGQEFRKNLSRSNKLSLLERNDIENSYPGLVENCQKISENLKLKLCAFDIIIDETGHYKFLEINSVPGWTYLEDFINKLDVNRNLTREILEHIIK